MCQFWNVLFVQKIETTLYRDEGGLGFSIAGGRGSVPFQGNDNVSISITASSTKVIEMLE